MQKKLFIVLNFKVTARAYIIKIWLFLHFLLNCWSVCNRTWFVITASWARVFCAKKWVTVFKVKVTAKAQGVSECLSGWCLLSCRSFCYQTWYGSAASWALLFSRSRSQQGLMWSKYDSAISSELLIHWQPNLVWWYIFISQSVLWKNWITAFKV